MWMLYSTDGLLLKNHMPNWTKCGCYTPLMVFFSRTTCQIGPNVDVILHWWSSSQEPHAKFDQMWMLYSTDGLLLKNHMPNWTKCGLMVFFQYFVRWPCPSSKIAAMASDWLKNCKSLRIFYFWNNWWNETKFGPNSPWMDLHQLTKMATMADNITFGFPALS
jgi:hypothetical protein